MDTTSSAPTPLLELLFEDPNTGGRCLLAPDGRVLRANAEWLRATGLELDEVIGEDFLALFPEARHELAGLHARARSGERLELPPRRQVGPGGDAWWAESVAPVSLEGGTGLLITSREVPDAAVPRAAVRPAGRTPDVIDLLAHIRRIADRAPAAVFVKGADGRYLFVSRWLRELLGVRRREILGRTAREVFPPEVARRVEEHDRRVAAGVEVVGEEAVPTTSGERVLMALVFPFPLGGHSVGTIGIGLDVTERRRAEAALRESEERFRLLAQAMPQIVCVLRPDGTTEYVNPSWSEYSGLDQEATQRMGWGRVLHPDDVAAALACRRRALKTLVPQDVELRYRAADGSFRWFLSRLAPVVEGGRVVRFVGAAMDIEDRRRGEDAMRQQLALQDQLAKVAASVPGVVCSFRLRPDGSASLPFSTPRISELYGLSQDELARDMSPAFARHHPDDLPAVKESIAASARSMSRWHAEFRYAHPTKGLRWIEGTSIPVREPDGSVLWHGYVADVTERRQATEALRRSEQRLKEEARRKDEFLAVLSHELRNPLAPIRTGIEILRRADPQSPEAVRALEALRRQAEHLERIVEDLLEITRITRGKVTLRREVLDLRPIVREATDDLRPQYAATGVVLRVELPDAPVWADVDPVRIAQGIGNLLANAAKFTPAAGTVTVTLAEAEGRAEVRVRDDGIGMEPDLIERLFEPFAQANAGLGRTKGGLGLGLAVVRMLVELHGGLVRARSAGPGTGSEFVVSLPLAAAAPACTGRAAPCRSTCRRSVLVIEDNADTRQTLADLLRLEGHAVRVAADGRTGITLAHELRPDVVVCDIGLPDVDGFEVARALRSDETLSGTRLVALTGYALPEDRRRAAEAGFDLHLAKPPHADELARAIQA